MKLSAMTVFVAELMAGKAFGPTQAAMDLVITTLVAHTELLDKITFDNHVQLASELPPVTDKLNVGKPDATAERLKVIQDPHGKSRAV